jgi:hypothetical protein
MAHAAGTLSNVRKLAGQPFRGPLIPSLVYVASAPTNSIIAYASDEAGNALPVLTLQGPLTGLDGPVGLTFDTEGRLYVVNHGASSSVTVYAPFAQGNVAPLRTLAGPKTDLNASAQPPDYPTGAIAVDLAHDRMFVARVSDEKAPLNGTVLVFPATAAGDEAPSTAIGPPTSYGAGWTTPGLALDAGQGLLVGSNLSECCHGTDGWSYYRKSDLTSTGRFVYYENFGLNGLAVAPSTGAIVASYDFVLDVWPPNITGVGDCAVCAQSSSPALTLQDPLGVGFTAVAVDANDTTWALSGSSALEAFPLGSATPRIITGLVGAAAIAFMPPLAGGLPHSFGGGLSATPFAR